MKEKINPNYMQAHIDRYKKGSFDRVWFRTTKGWASRPVTKEDVKRWEAAAEEVESRVSYQ